MITLELVLAASAFLIATCAAIFSVTGIGKLFAGAAISAMAMAGALELGKLVSVSFLYRYWKTIPKILKGYLVTSSVILMLITSGGIYGYLSSAYAVVAAGPLKENGKIQVLSSQISTIESEINRKSTRISQISSLRGQQETRLDNVISKSTTGSNKTISDLQKQLKQSDADITALQKEISSLSKQKDSISAEQIQTQTNISTNSDIGTFVYIANALGVPLDSVVKWFVLIIVLVFDPLSVSLVLAYNFLKENKQKESLVTELPIYSPEMVTEKPADEVDLLSVYDGKLPYYMEPLYEWGSDTRWQQDSAAIQFKKYIDSRHR